MLLYIILPVTLVIALYIFMKAVPPASARIIVNRFDGRIKVLATGMHFYVPFFWAAYGTGPFTGLSSNKVDSPAHGTKIQIDPPKACIHTADGISGTVDVTVYASILPWDKRVVSAKGHFKVLATQVIHRWLSSIVGQLQADEVVFHNLSTHLNTKKNIGELNADLSIFCLEVNAVYMDTSGIQLSSIYTQQRNNINARMQLLAEEKRKVESEIKLQELRYNRDKRAAELKFLRGQEEVRRLNSLAKQKAIGDAEAALIAVKSGLAQAQIKKEMRVVEDQAMIEQVAKLMEKGIDSHDIANLLVVRESAKALALSKADKIVAVPPSMCGLFGLDLVRSGLGQIGTKSVSEGLK